MATFEDCKIKHICSEAVKNCQSCALYTKGEPPTSAESKTCVKRYIENPKTKGSGILCCIPQKGECPMKCKDCYFQSGRSYLEPLEENLPNMPPIDMALKSIVRVNDGNDSSNDKDYVIRATADYPHKFYNTSVPYNLEEFPAPVILTVNPGRMTDHDAHFINPTPNLMFVRVRVNTWNLLLVDNVVRYYTNLGIPVVFTFMAYYEQDIPKPYLFDYVVRKRTLNEYYAITDEAFERVMKPYFDNPLVQFLSEPEICR